jgi:hypothetical protein
MRVRKQYSRSEEADQDCKEIHQFLNLISPETRRDAIGEKDLETIEVELNTSEDYRTRIIQ